MLRIDLILKNLPGILWSTVLGLLEWIVPGSFYAKDISNDTALVTGAASGLGRDISLELAKAGASLVLWDIDKKGLEMTKNLINSQHSQTQIGPKTANKFCLIYQVDVSKRAAVKRAAQMVQDDLNDVKKVGSAGQRHVSILVNNAGIYYGKHLLDLSDEQIERMFSINILSHFWTVRTFLPKMIEHKRGHILEIASVAGLCGATKQVTYCTTKFATVGFQEALENELQHMGLGKLVKTTVVCPYFFSSNLLDGLDWSIIGRLTSNHVAQEAVLSMRCNHTRIIVPKSHYLLLLIKAFSNQRAGFAWSKALGVDRGLKEVRGRALDQLKT